MEDKFYIINLDDSQGPGTHWVVVHNVGQECYHFDSFGVAPAKEIIEFMKNCEKQIYFNIYRVQPLNSYMCGYYCIDFINSINKGMTYADWLLQYNPKKFRRNDEIVKRNLKLK